MVCMDGFILTHAYERVDIPSQEQVNAYLPPFVPRQVLDPEDPVSIGAMVGPEAFTEVRYLAHMKQLQALDLIPKYAEQFQTIFGRSSGGLLHTYKAEDAETMIVAMGSILGTIKDSVDELREAGHRIGVMGITSFRPFPMEAVQKALAGAKRIVVVEKNIAVGMGGVLAANVHLSLGNATPIHTVVAGLGGRPVLKKSIGEMLLKAERDKLEKLSFLDLDHELVARELEREKISRRSGPAPENMLKDKGAAAAKR
jgi:pyruvate ferredoxin oxidoreductase alpha subunit